MVDVRDSDILIGVNDMLSPSHDSSNVPRRQLRGRRWLCACLLSGGVAAGFFAAPVGSASGGGRPAVSIDQPKSFWIFPPEQLLDPQGNPQIQVPPARMLALGNEYFEVLGVVWTKVRNVYSYDLIIDRKGAGGGSGFYRRYLASSPECNDPI